VPNSVQTTERKGVRKTVLKGVGLWILGLLSGSELSAQSADIIRGRATDAQGQGIPEVNVRATSYAGRVMKTAKTDKNGRYTIIFVNGEGDYWMEFAKLGYALKRFEIRKVGDEEVLLADARMSSTVAALDPMTTTAQRDRQLPNRNSAGVDVSGGDRALSTTGTLPGQEGNLAAMAAGIPGFQLVPGFDGAPDTYSVLGLDPNQSNVTFNGLGSGITTLPPDVLATTSISPYSFDVSRGGFSGAQIAIQTMPGQNFSRRLVANNSVAPPLEWADNVASAQNQKYTNLRLGGNALGPISFNRVFYNAAWNVGRRFSDLPSLLGADASGLAGAGIAKDSVERFLNVLASQGVPAGTALGTQALDVGEVFANVDVAPSAGGTGHSLTMGGVGNVRRSKPVDQSGLLLATRDHGRDVTMLGGNVAATHMNYFGFGVLSKTTFGVAGQSNRSGPFERIPEGIVRVRSTLPEGSSVRSLSFGGNPVEANSADLTLQVQSSLAWFSLDNRHTLKLTSSVMRDAFTSDASRSSSGTFVFNSLADLDAGVPASFTRTLVNTEQRGSQLSGSISFGDYWRPRDGFQLQYGLRVDGNRFLVDPATNPNLLQQLGVDTHVVPNRAYVSPRLGMQWFYGKASEVQYAPGSARPPRAVIHAGAGVFQNMAPARLIANSLASNGLPSSTQSVTCVGDAVPVVNWSSFISDPGSIPSQCADGTTGASFGAVTPGVVAFDPGYRQPRAIRAAGDWSGPVIDNRFVFGVQGVVSRNEHQPGFVDMNASRTIGFWLPNEDNRPVFATESQIVSSSGAIAAGAGRVTTDYQRVMLQRSGLTGLARQLTLNLKPVTARPKLRWDLSYTLLDAREEYYGFTSTAGDPWGIARGIRPDVSRQMAMLRWNEFPIFNLFFVTTTVIAASGHRYTPMIGGDVNGDGALNDRAYIADSAALGSLMVNGSEGARECLARQMGRIADRASCQGPTTFTSALGIKLNPAKLGLPKRATIGLSISNPIGVVDYALHGAGDVRGWGQAIPPDQNLLFVRGFDPVKKEFLYDVNERFGSTRPRESAVRSLPFVSLSVTVDIGLPRERQVLTQFLDAGRSHPGERATWDFMKQMGQGTIPNSMAMILSAERELGLTRAQADSLANMSLRYTNFADSLWTPMARELAALPEWYDRGEAYARYVRAREATVDYLLGVVGAARDVLTPSQRRRLPPQIAVYLDRRVLEFLRSSSAGDVGRVTGR
jgi:hypothetical protein